MIRGIDVVTFFSANSKELAKFYQEKVGLKLSYEAEMGEGNEALYVFEFKDSSDFIIMTHSKVKGKNTSPERFLVNFEVDNIEKEAKRLESEGVKKIQDVYHVEEYGFIATFEDLDGNYFQIVQVRE